MVSLPEKAPPAKQQQLLTLSPHPLVSFTCLAWKIYSIPNDWTVSGQLLRHVLGGVSQP
jgi:hypothetical protein